MNTIKKMMQDGKPVLNGWLSQASAFKAEIMGNIGYHSLTVDLQHGLQHHSQMLQAFFGIDHRKTTPIVRVAWNREEDIMRALDAGALGIICPMVNSRADALKFVSSLYYPPIGMRSVGPIRSQVVYPNYMEVANDEVLGFAMIETKQAVGNLDEILSVPNLSGVYIGPSDLSVSHGFQAGFDRKEPEMREIIRFILTKAKQNNLYSGIHTDQADYAIEMIQAGFDLVTLSSDIRAMKLGLQQAVLPFLKKFPSTKNSGI